MPAFDTTRNLRGRRSCAKQERSIVRLREISDDAEARLAPALPLRPPSMPSHKPISYSGVVTFGELESAAVWQILDECVILQLVGPMSDDDSRLVNAYRTAADPIPLTLPGRAESLATVTGFNVSTRTFFLSVT